MDFSVLAVIAGASYLIGSIPNGLLLGRWLWRIDLRQFGSKNIGATNAFRVLGPWPALGVFFTDAAKGVAGVFLGQWLAGTPLGMLVGGIAAIAGHNWSVFLKFKGGRGVATGLGVIAVLVPKVTLIVFAVWCVIVYFSRYVSLASIIAAALVPMLMRLFNERMEFYYFGLLAAAFVIIRHKPNIERLLKGKELKIKAGQAGKEK
ncbi:glycerol-3-phosphate 1-O-acyltransferase PlsY|uniref:Glycerol-3-phosphate acyltransferase n=1 Tax=Dendrosporobacter quercicolus TaxID=146817 RepID=A0A1G9L5I7_9FIRM|nr:glycerol-3-phosphate 1-O-acyltransferase PlsY [Dendrosporobacter quercicolus]NSL46595.1 glycerol-3-phosphate 1-O-acyltransferase PlsY [Dendrosporobacter quercicolus DSM 1736]SDL56845.1 glycerol-3-phosphate acyltransferase PlsY [Dendrosporobacter quercicolus]